MNDEICPKEQRKETRNEEQPKEKRNNGTGTKAN